MTEFFRGDNVTVHDQIGATQTHKTPATHEGCGPLLHPAAGSRLGAISRRCHVTGLIMDARHWRWMRVFTVRIAASNMVTT
jgi:hypothetical protein